MTVSALPQFFAKNAEDVLMLNLVRKLRIGMDYVDIGVCHPLLRNNTYLFYAMGGKGLLVEPNPAIHALIELYRPKDRLIKAGVASKDGSLNCCRLWIWKSIQLISSVVSAADRKRILQA